MLGLLDSKDLSCVLISLGLVYIRLEAAMFDLVRIFTRFTLIVVVDYD